jgi:hypothetical protein
MFISNDDHMTARGGQATETFPFTELAAEVVPLCGRARPHTTFARFPLTSTPDCAVRDSATRSANGRVVKTMKAQSGEREVIRDEIGIDGTVIAPLTRSWNDRDRFDLMLLHERTARHQGSTHVLLCALWERQEE